MLIDGGDLFAKNKPFQRFYAELFVEALNIMGYDAFNIGRRELLEGIEMIGHMQQLADFPLVSANLQAEPTYWQPYTIKSVLGVRVALMGVVAPSHGMAVPATSIFPPVEAMCRQMDHLKGKADVFVLLSQMDRDQTRTLIGQVPGLDIVISLQDAGPDNGEAIGDTLLISPGKKGEHVGIVDVVWDDQARQISTMAPQIYPLDDRYAYDREIIALVENFNLKVDRERAQAAKSRIKKNRRINAAIKQNMQMTPEEFINRIREQKLQQGAVQQ